MNFKDVNKIFVIKLRHIGDVLLTVPVFRALRETFPGAHITALVNSGTEEVLRGNPLIDEIILMDRSIKKLPKIKHYLKEFAFWKNIKGKSFDMAVDLTGGDRAAILSFVSGAKYRLGPKSSEGFIGKNRLYTHLSEPDGKRHTVLQNLDIVSQFGISPSNLLIDLHITGADRTYARKILEENNIEKADVIVHIHPTSRWLFKCWKDEYMAEIINWLLGMGIKVIVTSSPEEKEMAKAKRILSLVGDCPRFTGEAVESGLSPQLIDLCGKTTIKQLAAISEASDLFFGVDSAPMHIAAAIGTPVVALFGPSGAFHWGPWDNSRDCPRFTDEAKRSRRIGTVPMQWQRKTPYSKQNGIQTFGRHTVIQMDWECIPCGKDGCDGSKISKCLEDMEIKDVKKILEEKLDGINKHAAGSA